MPAQEHLYSKHRFAALDGLRGCCALLVAIYHFAPSSHFRSLTFVRGAWLLVDFFFVLSGFVIAFGFEGRIERTRDALAFMLRRFGRLWPLHMTIISLLLLGEVGKVIANSAGIASQHPAFSYQYPLRDLPLSPLFLTLLSPSTWNGVSWSISAEFWTYLIFAMINLAPRQGRQAWYGLASLIGLICVAIFSPVGMMTTTVWGEFRCLFGFFIGVITFHFWRKCKGSIPTSTLAEAGVVLAVLAFLHFSHFDKMDFAAPVLFAIAVFVFASQGGFISQILQTVPFQLLGLWSYGIYMLHPFVMDEIMTRGGAVLGHILGIPLLRVVGQTSDGAQLTVLGPSNPWWGDGLTVLYIAIVIGLAALSFRYIERPGRRIFNRLGRLESHDRIG